MGFWNAVASAEPFANNLHLAADRTTPTPHHSIFYRPNTLPDAQPQCQTTVGILFITYEYLKVGMLIPGKLHSRVETRNSRVSTETFDFARVRTIYQLDRSWITGGDARGGDRRPAPDAVPGPCQDPIAACRRSTQPAVAHPKRCKKADGGEYSGSATGETQWPIGPWRRDQGITATPLPHRWTPLDKTISRHRERMGTFNGGQQRVSGAVVHVSKHIRNKIKTRNSRLVNLLTWNIGRGALWPS